MEHYIFISDTGAIHQRKRIYLLTDIIYNVEQTPISLDTFVAIYFVIKY